MNRVHSSNSISSLDSINLYRTRLIESKTAKLLLYFTGIRIIVSIVLFVLYNIYRVNIDNTILALYIVSYYLINCIKNLVYVFIYIKDVYYAILLKFENIIQLTNINFSVIMSLVYFTYLKYFENIFWAITTYSLFNFILYLIYFYCVNKIEMDVDTNPNQVYQYANRHMIDLESDNRRNHRNHRNQRNHRNSNRNINRQMVEPVPIEELRNSEPVELTETSEDSKATDVFEAFEIAGYNLTYDNSQLSSENDYIVDGRNIIFKELNPECSITREKYENGDDIMILICGHHFSDLAIRDWLKYHDSCPLCRTLIKYSN